MIEKITITNDNGHSLDLILNKPELSGLIVKSVTGLGASKTNIATTDDTSVDGANFNNAKLQKRNIVFNLLFMETESETIDEVRQKTYYYFSQKKPIDITVKTETRHCKCTGYVESNEANIFDKHSGCTITVVCPDPYFYSLNNQGRVLTEFSSVDSVFEFPFANESVTDDLLIMSKINVTYDADIINDGDGEVGLIIYIHVLGPATDINIYNIDTRERMFIDTTKLSTLLGSELKKGDTITINTLRGQKSMTILRNGNTTNIINCLKRDSKWFTIQKGNNIFAYTTTTGADNLQFSVFHQLIYYGV